MFRDCITDSDKHEYKRSGKLKNEFDKYNKDKNPDYYRVQRIGSYNEVFDKICDLITGLEDTILSQNNRFLYFIDHRFLFDTTRGYRFENLTINYQKILDYGLEELKYQSNEVSNTFCRDYNRTIDSLIKLVRRISKEAISSKHVQWFVNMQKCKANGFEEALQRILFVNQILWQTGHRLMGLGHLDFMLYPFYKEDLNNGRLTKQDALDVMRDFLETLHRYYWLKSNVMLGDTGQIIILGKSDLKGNYLYNELTYLWIESLMELKLPEPKLLLRVNKKVPRDLLHLALRCISLGLGSPMLSNDEVVVPRLLEFGVDEKDCVEYGTSACWEPLIPGKSISQNNISCLSYPKVLDRCLRYAEMKNAVSFDAFMELFEQELVKEIKIIKDTVSEFRLQYNPLLSIFGDDCFLKKRDVSCGGAVYSNYGLTTVGLSNTINSLINIKKYVFDDKIYTLSKIVKILDSDYKSYERLQNDLKDMQTGFGCDDNLIKDITNRLLYATTKETKNYRNYLGGKLKFGVSAPSYIDAAKDFPATFDGRNKGDAFGVHISSEKNSGYTEVVNFAAMIDYGENRINGNVVDLMVTSNFIKYNFEKILDFLYVAIKVGFFEMQMNVVSSKKLIEAKKFPEKYRELVVRVWGFSAYFNDLPLSYKDVLIQRALENERSI